MVCLLSSWPPCEGLDSLVYDLNLSAWGRFRGKGPEQDA